MVFGWDDLLGAVAPQLISGLIGQDQASKDANKARGLLQDNASRIMGIELPDVEKQRLALQQYVSAGEYNPEILQQLQQYAPSALENIQLDPRLRQSQMTALESMSDRAMGKMSDADMAAFELARKKAAGETQAKSAQILQQMQARGQGGSGAALAAQLSNAQAGGNMLQDAGLQEAVAQQKAREAALMNMGNMANSLRSQDYGEQANLANSRNAINQMNTNQSNQLAQGNVATKNQAALTSLNNRQSLANQNTGLANQQQIANKGLLQQQYQNRLGQAQAAAGQNSALAQNYNQNAAGTAGMWGGIGQAAGTAFTNALSPTAKFDATTGKQLYDPQTGKPLA